MKAEFASWKTTVCGGILAGLEAYRAGAFEDPADWRRWVVPVALAVFGFLVRDADKSSRRSGVE